MNEIIAEIREGLDDMVRDASCNDPEFYKINAVRFMEHYKLMRALERQQEKTK